MVEDEEEHELEEGEEEWEQDSSSKRFSSGMKMILPGRDSQRTSNLVPATFGKTYGIPVETNSALLSTILACELVTLQSDSWFRKRMRSPGLMRPSAAAAPVGSRALTMVPHRSNASASSCRPYKRKNR